MKATQCTVQDCDRTDIYKSRGLCRLHYKRWWRTGDSLGLRNLPADVTTRFWTKVDATGICWLWTAGVDRHGYGHFQSGTSRADARNTLAHVYAYELLVGPVPAGLELDHLCRVPSCVNPDHLEPVTHAENMRRGNFGHYAQRKRMQTECRHGHPFDAANTITTGRGHRRCRACKNAADARRYRRRINGRLPDRQSAGSVTVPESA